MVANNINEYAISETQKYGHVTYFWNGNRSDKFSEECIVYSIKQSFQTLKITDEMGHYEYVIYGSLLFYQTLCWWLSELIPISFSVEPITLMSESANHSFVFPS